MRVAQVIGRLASAGVEAVVNNYYRFMDTERIQFDYVIDDDSVCAPREEILDRGARYYVVPPSSRPLARVAALVKLFRKERYAIVHVHMNTLNAPVLFAAWAAGVPVRISHNHSMSDASEGKRALIKRMLRPTAGWFATAYMACGEEAARWMFGDAAWQDGRVTLLPNAIDVERYRFDAAARAAVRRELCLSGKLVIGHVGRFMQQKNHTFLIEAFACLRKRRPDAVLLLVGDGELRMQIEAEVKSLGMEQAVRFLGIRTDVGRLYSAMDVFVLPSHYEGLPVVGIESQASGLPCLFSDRIDHAVAVTGDVHFLALEEGAGTWAEAMEEMAARAPEERSECADRLIGGRWDIRQTSAELAALYTRLSACARKQGSA